MQQFQSLQRLIIFYGLTVLVMLALYYFTLFYDVKQHNEEQSVDIFHTLQHEITSHTIPVNTEIKTLLEQPAFEDISYQLIFMMPSGQTYIHRHVRSNEPAFATVTFPIILSPFDDNSHSAYTLSNRALTGTIKLKSGHQIYIILRHKPIAIDWISYRYWLPLMTAIMFFLIAIIYMLSRRNNWEQLLSYTDSLSSHAKEAYSPPPFLHKNSTPEFLYLGHALSRVSYQLHNDYRRIKTLNHRLERLVEQAPLPMLMIMRHGQISFFNQRFEQIFMESSQEDKRYELTDFVAGKDASTQQLLQTLASLRLTRTLIVYGLQNKQTYQLHVTPWFGEHEQIHGFTVLLSNIHEFANQTEQLQLQNQQLQQKLDELNKLRSLTGYQLRIPLEAMIDLLEPIDPSTLTPERHEILKSLITASQSMLNMLNNTFGIEEVEVRKTRLTIEPIDIYKLGQEINNLVISNARQQGIELIYFFMPDCPRCIDTDDIRLRQILLNLLKNAIKFTTSGHVSLIIDRVTKAQIMDIGKDHLLPSNENKLAEPSSHWVRFSIEDTGIGISADKQKKLMTSLFQNDQQAHEHIEQNTVKTGIGLNNANSFAQLLGGFIELKSTVGKGSIFNLYLPCRRPNYQPIYHHNQQLTNIHLIAIVNQPLVATKIQRLCTYLSVATTIYTSIDLVDIQSLTEKLAQMRPTLVPILLLDYEYYETITTPIVIHTTSGHNTEHQKPETVHIEHDIVEPIETVDKASINRDRQEALNTLLTHPSLPKILFSIKPERRIPSVLLGKYDGFLNKPLDMTLLLSEMLRLTATARQKLVQPLMHEENSSPLTPVANESISVFPNGTPLPLILVVEDSPTNQKITCKMLSKLGYRSIVAEDGQQALDCLKSQRHEILLILMDCRMPVMDGLQATQAIRAQGDDIPIVALTANNTQEDREACIQAGMDEFLTKPINRKALVTVLQAFITAS